MLYNSFELDVGKVKYAQNKLGVQFHKNKTLKVYRYYLKADGVENVNNFMEYEDNIKIVKL